MNERFSQGLTVHQVHFRASAGDAITQHMFFIQEALAEVGVSGKIFAPERKNLPTGKVHPWSLDSVWDCDLLLVHHSQANPEIKPIAQLEIPKALIYHSQPPESFYGHDRKKFGNLKAGKKQLSFWRRQGVPAFGVSRFCAQELEALGFSNPAVIPLLDLQKKEVNKERASGREPKHLLFVGKLLPHKRQSQLIETFYHLKKGLPPKSQFHLVGTGDSLYTKYLKLLIRQLGLTQQVFLTGKLTDADLYHYYSLADAFVCLSAHEGFCLPVVEAMNQEVPVFYRPHTGILETMGEAGVQLLTDCPIENAPVIRAFLESPEAQEAVVKKQKQRLNELALFQNRKQLQQKILALCGKNRGLLKPTAPQKKVYDAPLSI